MPSAIEGLLRYTGLARKIMRIARESVDLGGTLIPAGHKVRLPLNSVNRDPEQFAEPKPA
jgi:cytochrome P450